MIKKKVVLGAVMLAAFCVGIWFIVSPSINRQADLEQQSDLLESIEALLPAYVAIDTPIETQTIETQTIEDEAVETGHEPLQAEDEPTEDEPIEELPTFEPLDPTAFPNGIIPIGILTINSIDLRLPVKEGTTEPELRIAPGRVSETAQVGEIGNAVIAGHRNYTFGAMFNRLGEVEIGDIIGFQAMSGQEMSFEIFEVSVIVPDDQIAFVQPQSESIITLYTCTPIREATHRLIVRARIIEGGLF